MNRSLLVGALLLSTTTVHAGDKSQDIADIQHVMDAFHHAVVTHDGTTLATLFIPEGSAWLNVLSEDAYARAKAKSPDVAKVRLGSYKDFAGFVSKSKDSLDPKHSHVRIQSDGVIATAYFDFVFLVNGKAENQGSETWQLVKGTEGWRIAAITYSSNPP
jgi:hypothetical protein